MKNTVIYLTTALVISVGSQTFAQETTATKTTKAKPAVTETTTTQQTTNTTDQAYPVAGDPAEIQPGQVYVREKKGAWDVKCIKAETADAKDSCTLYQLILDSNGSPVAEINMQRLPEGGKAEAGVVFISPLETLLTKQVVIRVDAGKSNRYPFAWCDKFGCYARFGLTPAQTAAMRKGAKATVTVFSLAQPDKPLNLSVSLKGFTAAWNAIKS